MTTRFTPYHGYYIESRRGGGGYIKIMKVTIKEPERKNLIKEAVGESITKNKAYDIIKGLREQNVISEREEAIMKAAIEDMALSIVNVDKNKLRADILKNMLLVLFR